MAGDKVNTYAQDGQRHISITANHRQNIQGLSSVNINRIRHNHSTGNCRRFCNRVQRALYKFDTEEAISTTDPVTSSTVADGAVYVCIVPDTTTATAEFTATAPTWSDSKQGWYGTGGQANYRYVNFRMDKSGASYYDKRFYDLYKKIRTVDLLYPSLGAFTIRTSAADNEWYRYATATDYL